MKSGYIALHRKIQENFLWQEKRIFSRAEAWIDILMEARWNEEPQEFVIKNTKLICHYGESLYSLDTWARRWGWSKSRVRRVLNLFKECSMIDLKSETVTVRLTVLNYSDYDPRRNANEPKVKRKRNASETHSTPKEKGEKGKEQYNNATQALPEWLDAALWEEYRQSRVALNARMTPEGEKRNLAKLEKLIHQGGNQAEILGQSIERGWKGLFPVNGAEHTRQSDNYYAGAKRL